MNYACTPQKVACCDTTEFALWCSWTSTLMSRVLQIERSISRHRLRKMLGSRCLSCSRVCDACNGHLHLQDTTLKEPCEKPMARIMHVYAFSCCSVLCSGAEELWSDRHIEPQLPCHVEYRYSMESVAVYTIFVGILSLPESLVVCSSNTVKHLAP